MTRTTAYAASEALTTVAGDTNVSAPGTTKVTLTHTPGDSERWWYFSNMVVSHNDATTDIIARFYQETAAVEFGNVSGESQDATNKINVMWGTEHTYGVSPGSQDIKLQFWNESSGVTNTARYAHILGVKCEANDFSAASDGSTNIISSTFSTKVTLTETLNGNYVIFCFAEVGNGSNGNPYTVRADYGGTKYGSMTTSTPDNATWRTWSTMFVLEGLSGSQTIFIEMNSANGDLVTDLKIRRARIFALCLDNFANYDFVENRTRDNNNTTTPEDQSSLTFSPLATRDHLAFGAAIGDQQTLGVNGFAEFEVDGTAIVQQEEEPNNVGDMSPMFGFRQESLSGAPVFKTQKWTESGGDAGLKESSIVVVDLADSVSYEAEISSEIFYLQQDAVAWSDYISQVTQELFFLSQSSLSDILFTGSISQEKFWLSQSLTGEQTGTVASFTFSAFKNSDLIDWQEEAYDSYMKVFWLLPEDPMSKFWTPYIYSFVKTEVRDVTDSGVVVTDSEEPVFITSSLYMAPLWNFESSANQDDFLQVYKHRENYLNSVAKNRIRGNGKALQLHFKSDGPAPFSLQGWGVYLTKNTKV